MAEQGPFARATLNESFLVLLMFMISTTVPSLALSADVAVRKRTEQSLRQAQARLDRIVQERTAALEEIRQALHQAQKMEALGQLAGGIAHDFNNILTVITSSLEALRTSVSAAGQAPQRVDRALEAARNGASLIQQMLVFARRHPLQLAPTEVNAIITASLRMFTRSCPATIKVHTALASDLRPVLADPTQLQTAILNLAVNARDAMPCGGTLTISTSLSSADYVCITVSDTGIGMTPETLARAFEPFFTTKEIGKGTGLGLSMVYSATRQMGGDATIESRPGAGTTVRLLLPAAAVASSGEAQHAELAPAVLRTQAEPTSVLYVEDNSLVSFATVDLLKDAGYAVHVAREAERALALLDEHPEIELLVTDIGLPGMNGHELAAEARRRRPDLKVLFVSGYDRTRFTAEPAEDPYTRYLGKPYQERDLCEALRQLSGAEASEAGQAL
jgi:signal transduction histidine kinase/CheY-like chemotaxis protein